MRSSSIVICTFNRDQLYAETLESLALHLDLWRQKGEVEIVLVNNNSKDRTDEISRSFAARFAGVKVLDQPLQGLSNARNMGVENSANDVVIFLDDDVEVPFEWLPETLAPFSEDDVAVTGGKVLPFGLTELPSWLPREYAYLASVFDPSDEARDLPKVMGANFAVRRRVFGAAGLFNPQLGRNGGNLLGGEEVDLLQRILALGLRVRYTPSSVVYHKIQSKLNTEYILGYARQLGLSEARMERSAKSGAKYRMKVIRSLLFPALIYPWYSLFWESKSRQIKCLIKQNYGRGYLDAARDGRTA